MGLQKLRSLIDHINSDQFDNANIAKAVDIYPLYTKKVIEGYKKRIVKLSNTKHRDFMLDKYDILINKVEKSDYIAKRTIGNLPDRGDLIQLWQKAEQTRLRSPEDINFICGP